MEKDGERHRFLRGVIGTSLGYAGLETLVPKLCNFVQLYLSKSWRGREEISLYRSTKVLTFSIVFECLLGIKVEPGMVDTFERVLEGVFFPAIKFPGSKFWRAMKARKEIEKVIMKVVRKKRKEIEEGRFKREEDTMLMSKLVYGMIQGEITEKEIIDNVVLLIFAAHDTTSFAVAMTFKMLAQHPDCYGKVLQGNIISNLINIH
jgi:cytochrome P450